MLFAAARISQDEEELLALKLSQGLPAYYYQFLGELMFRVGRAIASNNGLLSNYATSTDLNFFPRSSFEIRQSMH